MISAFKDQADFQTADNHVTKKETVMHVWCCQKWVSIGRPRLLSCPSVSADDIGRASKLSVSWSKLHRVGRAIQGSAVKGQTTRYSCIWAESRRARERVCGRRRIALSVPLFCQAYCWRVVKTRPENEHKKEWTNYFWGSRPVGAFKSHTAKTR